MEITIKEVTGLRLRSIFINLPKKIHRGHSQWVPPIYLDDRSFFNPGRNESFKHSDTIMLLAFKDRRAVGRIMGIINCKYNTQYDLKEARFCFLETYNDPSVTAILIQRVENWARQKNMELLVGPLGFSDKDPQGFLIEGFNEPIVIATNCNFPYQVEHIESLGFTKKTDLVVYKLNIPEEMPDIYRKIIERTEQRNNGVHMVKFSGRKHLRRYVRPVLQLMNNTFKDIYAFVPLTGKEMKDFANRYIYLLDHRYIKVIENSEGSVVAFVLAMPDISEGIRRCKGRILPFGIFKILHAKKKTQQLNLLLGAVHPEYRNAGLDALLGVSLLQEARNSGLKVIDSHLELENNSKMRAEMEKMGGVVYKRYRIFEKRIS
jgi:GNAT superfamily N-acetyltransferase